MAAAQQSPDLPSAPAPQTMSPYAVADAQASSSSPQQTTSNSSQAAPIPGVSPTNSGPGVDKSQIQPKRILGLMPNYRAVSAGAIPPPPTVKQAFVLATQNTFDYSSFIFVGLTSLIAKGEDAHPDLGKGVPGLWAYTWRGFIDKTDGNYLVLFALPTLLHEDERYYAMGHGKKLHRVVYSVDQVFVARDYRGHNTFNVSELLGRGIAQGVAVSYYPSQDATPLEVTEKFGYAVMRDALTNTFREFWPDIATHVLHMKQQE
ncbi:MAG: hypothetical protein ACYCSN_02535 [Acidobacteriaceae bacterium]